MGEPPTTKGPRSENDTVNRIRGRMRRDWPELPSCTEMQTNPAQLNRVLYAHDGPHDSAKIEWWYVNTHFGEGNRFSVFAAFFRLAIDGVAGAHAHAANWAFVDVESSAYRTYSFLDPATPAILGAMIESGEYDGDPFVRKALKELFATGRVPTPDTLMVGDPEVSAVGAPLTLNFGGNQFRTIAVDEEGVPTYQLILKDEDQRTLVDITLKPRCPPALSGSRGVVSTGQWQDDMFYYFSPLCDVLTARCVQPDTGIEVLASQGRAWVDHEFGGSKVESIDEVAAMRGSRSSVVDHSWEWAAIQLDNASKDAVTVTLLKKANKVVDLFAVYQDGSTGAFFRYDSGVVFDASAERWKSPVTGMPFPTKWNIVVPHQGGLTLQLVAPIANQEFVTLPGKPSYWEGRVSVSGTHKGIDGSLTTATGTGFMECHGERDLHAVSSAYTLMHAMLCAPVEMLPFTATTTWDTANSTVGAIVEQASFLIQMTTGRPVPPQHKELLRGLLAAYGIDHHHSKGVVVMSPHDGRQRLQALWDAVPSWDFPTLVLRAFTLRTLDLMTTVTAPAPQPKPTMLTTVGLPFLPDKEASWLFLPTDEDLGTPATPDQLSTLSALVSGMWAVDTAKPRGDIGDFLGEQGVGFVARKLCASVTPDLKTTVDVEGRIIHTDIITTISTSKIIVQLNGASWEWDSFGRGTMTSRACCRISEDRGACVVAISTTVAKGEKEYKWVVLRADGTMHEVLHLLPKDHSNNAPPRATCEQWFKRN